MPANPTTISKADVIARWGADVWREIPLVDREGAPWNRRARYWAAVGAAVRVDEAKAKRAAGNG
jgi:hypothetical protein